MCKLYVQCFAGLGWAKLITSLMIFQSGSQVLPRGLINIITQCNQNKTSCCYDAPLVRTWLRLCNVTGMYLSPTLICPCVYRIYQSSGLVYQLLSKLVSDLTYCATADLLPLLEITGVKQVCTNKLHVGWRTITWAWSWVGPTDEL